MSCTEDYIASHIDAEPPVLRTLYRTTHLRRLYPRMCSDHVQGRTLAMFTRMIRPARILELGTFSGYSTLCFAEAMPPGCRIDTVEIDTEHADELRELFDNDPRGNDIELHIGDALELIPKLTEAFSYDMVFLDANKRHYPEYYHLLMQALPDGAFILADNTLWDNKVADPDVHDAQTEGIRRFNDIVAADNDVEKIILPVRDGLSIIRKVQKGVGR